MSFVKKYRFFIRLTVFICKNDVNIKVLTGFYSISYNKKEITIFTPWTPICTPDENVVYKRLIATQIIFNILRKRKYIFSRNATKIYICSHLNKNSDFQTPFLKYFVIIKYLISKYKDDEIKIIPSQ